MHLNSAQNKLTDTNKWSAVSSTTFTVGNDPYTNSNGSPMLAYCWHSVTGYSSIGKYTGSGASGKTVTIGFEPSWVIIKNVTTTGLSWAIADNQRSTSNPRNLFLWADYNGVEYTQTNGLNFNSTGFEVLNATNWLNKSGDTLIYMAFK